MRTDRHPAGLLRVAAVPLTLLDPAGNPELFERFRARRRSEEQYARFATRLAERLTHQLIPHPELPSPVRGVALGTRRDLLRGHLVGAAGCRLLAVVNAALEGPDALTGALLRATAWSQDLRAEDRRLTEAVDHEQTRLATLPWELVSRSPAALRAVDDASSRLLAEIRERLATDPGWTGKRMRQRAEYLMRILARAAGKTTPRGWIGHVAVVPAGPGPADQVLVDARVTDYAVHTVGNIGEHRHELAAGAELPEAWLSMTGLHWVDGDRLCCWIADHDDPAGGRIVQVRRTPPVDVVRQALGGGVVRAAEVTALLAPAADEPARKVLGDFLRHLLRLGVVQASRRPASRLRRWSAEPRADEPAPGAFVDVYRRGTGHVPVPALDRLTELVAQARRVHAVVAQPASAHPALGLVDERPRPITEVVVRFLEAHPPGSTRQRHAGRSRPAPGTPHHELCAWLADQTDHAEVDITRAVLDRIGAPEPPDQPWPVDCLVRPLPAGKPIAVLEAVLPAGVGDARFADALRDLHEDVSHVDEYRAFLAAASARCGVEVVEVLVPPHGVRSANTVRRPRYTRVWTGDADSSTYLGEHPAPGRFLPLGQITVRRDGDRVVAEDPAGRPLWPIYHATRVPPPPWDAVVAVLAAAAPVGRLAMPFVPGDPTTAFTPFAGRDRAPRITVDGGLVLAPRAVVLAADRLAPPSDPIAERVRALALLRADTGLPRWNFVRARGADRPLPVDLDSITALRVLDRVLTGSDARALVFEEMVPGPDQLTVHDESGDPVAAQLLLRLPHRARPERLAEDVARVWGQDKQSLVVGAAAR